MNADAIRKEWHACKAIALQHYLHRKSQGRNTLSWSLLVLLVAVPLIGGVKSGHWGKSIGYGAALPLLLLTLLWWVMLLSSLMQQNQVQILARLVPGLRRRSLTVLFGCGGLFVLAFTALAVAAGAGWLVVCLVALASAVVLGCVCLLFFVPGTRYLLWILLLLQFLPRPAAIDYVLADLPLPIYVAAGAALLAWTVYATARQFGAATLPREGAAAVATQLLQRPEPQRARGGIYARLLARDCARVGGRSLLLHALGPAAHTLPGLVTVLVLTLIGLVLNPVPRERDPFGWFMPFVGPVLAVLLHHAAIASFLAHAVGRARAEQALVRLAVRVPQAEALNAELGRSMLVQYAFAWSASTAGIMLILYRAGIAWPSLLGMLNVLVLSAAVSGTMLRAYASASVHGGLPTILLLLWFLFLFCMAVLALSGAMSAPGVLLMSILTLALVWGFVRYRWRRMLHQAPAFPSARLV